MEVPADESIVWQPPRPVKPRHPAPSRTNGALSDVSDRRIMCNRWSGTSRSSRQRTGAGSPMIQPAIETNALTRDFETTRAVDGLSIRVEPGTVFGFLGPNGSGKTTTIRLLLGLLPPTSGSASPRTPPTTRSAPPGAASPPPATRTGWPTWVRAPWSWPPAASASCRRPGRRSGSCAACEPLTLARSLSTATRNCGYRPTWLASS